MSSMLLSIKPEFMASIISGHKRYEFRRVRCKRQISRIVFYETAPKKLIVAEAVVDDILEGPIDAIWQQAKEYAGISYEFFRQYYDGTKKAVAYRLKDVAVYSKPKELKDYGVMSPPQSFVYIED